ncbi:MAG: tetratricopeptide repeat protein [Chitinophagaceae bacterium]|nr:MAG: tetratricopeptide repeat protein [Chitinophagaceae bacterium]
MERLEKLKEFLKANPGDSFLNHALALEYLKLDDVNAAKEVFESLLERDPGYVGSYYHLAKLFEANGETDLAIKWYEKGIVKAKEAGDGHALNELKAAYEDLVY